MTRVVVAVRESANCKEIVDALAEFGISAVPVLDEDDRVVGVVSEADLLPKLEFAGDDLQAGLFDRIRQHAARAKATCDTAGELMTSPAITVDPDASIADAARLMDTERIKRLPVVGDEGRLAGIVTRRDLLLSQLRPDPGTSRHDDAADLGTRNVFETPVARRVRLAWTSPATEPRR